MKMKTQNVWDSAKEILKRNLIAPNIQKEESCQRKDFSFYFKKPEKEEPMKSKER